MSKYEWVDKLSEYLKRNYGMTISLTKDKDWYGGQYIRMSLGSKYSERKSALNDNDFENDVFILVNNYIKAHKLI